MRARSALLKESGARRAMGLVLERTRSSDLSMLPVAVGLALIWVVLQMLSDHFLSAGNLSNLVIQITPYGVLGIGLFLCLVVGEIDLSVGYMGGMCGAIFAVLTVNSGVDPLVALFLALLVGAAIGAFYGLIATQFGVPTFVVTLGGMLAWQGGLIIVLGKEGTINLQPSIVTNIIWTFLPPTLAWAAAALVVLIYAVLAFRQRADRLRARLPALTAGSVVLRAVVLVVGEAVVVAFFNSARGVPTALVVLLVAATLTEAFAKKSKYGRHIFAVGGDKEAARRAGIHVDQVRVGVMILCSTFAAFAGVLFASRLLSASLSSGGGDTLLNAIAAVVIGGTAFTGGRGSAYSAVLGMLVIGSIANGMDLLSLNSAIRLMITGGVLVAAVVIDSLNRRSVRQ